MIPTSGRTTRSFKKARERPPSARRSVRQDPSVQAVDDVFA
jgi:hypothetical protein